MKYPIAIIPKMIKNNAVMITTLSILGIDFINASEPTYSPSFLPINLTILAVLSIFSILSFLLRGLRAASEIAKIIKSIRFHGFLR